MSVGPPDAILLATEQAHAVYALGVNICQLCCNLAYTMSNPAWYIMYHVKSGLVYHIPTMLNRRLCVRATQNRHGAVTCACDLGTAQI